MTKKPSKKRKQLLKAQKRFKKMIKKEDEKLGRMAQEYGHC